MTSCDKSDEYSKSPNSSSSTSEHVVIVMDAMKEFSMETLQWAMDNVIGSGDVVTLLGLMPWLNPPSKQDMVSSLIGLGDLFALKERSEWKSDPKYQKVQAIVELCDKHGVVLNMKSVMGFPLRLVVLEQITSLHATWVVFDRHHNRKNRTFYAERIPCSIVMMTSNGEVEIAI